MVLGGVWGYFWGMFGGCLGVCFSYFSGIQGVKTENNQKEKNSTPAKAVQASSQAASPNPVCITQDGNVRVEQTVDQLIQSRRDLHLIWTHILLVLYSLIPLFLKLIHYLSSTTPFYQNLLIIKLNNSAVFLVLF